MTPQDALAAALHDGAVACDNHYPVYDAALAAVTHETHADRILAALAASGWEVRRADGLDVERLGDALVAALRAGVPKPTIRTYYEEGWLDAITFAVESVGQLYGTIPWNDEPCHVCGGYMDRPHDHEYARPEEADRGE